MKLSKKISLLILTVLIPINTLAYSEYIIPSGASIGIEINTDGIMIIGFYKTNGKENKSSEKLKVGDKIIKVISYLSKLISIYYKNKKGR